MIKIFYSKKMNIDTEKTKELNLCSPIVNMINAVLSLKFNKIFKSNNSSEDNFIDMNIFSDESDINFCFKVLILDEITFNFLSPLLKQATLKKNNICLTTKLKAKKDKMHNVMSIYLVTPSQENFKYILDDMKNKIYENYSLNFIEKPNDDILEEFLTNIIKLDIYNKVYNLNVLPIKFSLIHPKVFDFCTSDIKIKKPYSLINENIQNNETKTYYDLISNMLFNILFCMKICPLIKYSKGSFNDLIFSQIQKKFISTFNKFPELKNQFKNGNTLLVIIQRDFLDLPIMLHHPSGFGSLINDICGITFEPQNILTKDIKKFSLDPLNDFIWNESIDEFYHDVADKTLIKYKKHLNQLEVFDTGKKINNIKDLENKSDKLAQNIKELDHIRLEGDILEKHAKIYPYLNKNIDSRHLAQIYSIEKNILDKREMDSEINKNITDFIKEGKVNNDNAIDIFRLCLIYFLVDSDSGNDKFIKEIIQNLKLPSKYNSQMILEYLNLIKNGSRSSENLIDKLKSESEANKTMLGQVGGVTKKLFKKGFNFIKKAYKNFNGRNRSSIAIEILENCIYNKDKDFETKKLYEDKDIPEESNKKNIILFILGGGSLNEFEYCQEYFKGKYNFIYGADKIYSPNEFLDELNELSINTLKENKN